MGKKDTVCNGCQFNGGHSEGRKKVQCLHLSNRGSVIPTPGSCRSKKRVSRKASPIFNPSLFTGSPVPQQG